MLASLRPITADDAEACHRIDVMGSVIGTDFPSGAVAEAAAFDVMFGYVAVINSVDGRSAEGKPTVSGGQVVAYAIAQWGRREHLPRPAGRRFRFEPEAESEVMIHSLAVAREWRGQGLGTAMLLETIKLADGARNGLPGLGERPENVTAWVPEIAGEIGPNPRTFLQRFGFRAVDASDVIDCDSVAIIHYRMLIPLPSGFAPRRPRGRRRKGEV